MPMPSLDPKYRFLLVSEDTCTPELLDIFAQRDIQLDHEPSHLRAITATEDTLYHGLLIAVSGNVLSGLELCTLIRTREQRRLGNPAYIILLGQHKDLLPILTQGTGADDYLVGTWMDLELDWKVRKAVAVLDLLWAGPASQVMSSHPDLLSAEGLRTLLAEEVNRIGRRSGSMSLALLWLPDPGGLQASYGLDWMSWFTTRAWTHIRHQLRNYDRVAVLGNGFLCVISPDLDEPGTQALLDRLNTGLHGYQNPATTLTDIPLSLSARYLCVSIENNYHTLGRSAEILWEWIQTKSSEPLSAGRVGHSGHVSDSLSITPPHMPEPE